MISRSMDLGMASRSSRLPLEQVVAWIVDEPVDDL